MFGLFGFHPDNDPVGMHKVFDGRTFPQEFRIGNHTDPVIFRLIFLNQSLDPFSGPDRNRAFIHNYLVSVQMFSHASGDRFNIGQVC